MRSWHGHCANTQRDIETEDELLEVTPFLIEVTSFLIDVVLVRSGLGIPDSYLYALPLFLSLFLSLSLPPHMYSHRTAASTTACM